MSPDGTLIAVDNQDFGPNAVTNIYKNGTLTAAIPGIALGWLDNNRLLANQYDWNVNKRMFMYTTAVIFNADGSQVSTVALPELTTFQLFNADTIYDPVHNALYSLSTGAKVWSGASPTTQVGAVSGSYVVYAADHRVVAE